MPSCPRSYVQSPVLGRRKWIREKKEKRRMKKRKKAFAVKLDNACFCPTPSIPAY